VATLSDVAAHAGVSKATASRALGRPDLVAPATAERVRLAAAELRFVPNRGAQHLARGRTGIVSVVVPTLQNSFFTPIIAGAQTRAESAGIHVTVAVHPLQDEAGAARFEHLAAQVDGLIVVAPRGDDELVRRACALKPSVLVDREIPQMPSVSADTAGAFATLVGRLAEEGHERVAFLNGPEMSWQSGQRTAAVQEAAARLGIEVEVIGPSPATFAAGVARADDVIATGASVALPYASDLGLGLLFELVSRGRARFGEAGAVRSAVATTDGPPTTEHAIEVVGVPGAAAGGGAGAALGGGAVGHRWTLLGGGTPGSLQVRLPVPVAEQWAGPRGRA
jgi:DNA-binding LacI/PurR family transcriptional regulator